MALALSRRLSVLLAGSLQVLLTFDALPAKSASALAAWALTDEGVLKLRTSRDTSLEAFYQRSGGGKGARVWIDFPGELIRPRRIPGYGPLEEVRLGKPSKGVTRIVFEFKFILPH